MTGSTFTTGEEKCSQDVKQHTDSEGARELNYCVTTRYKVSRIKSDRRKTSAHHLTFWKNYPCLHLEGSILTPEFMTLYSNCPPKNHTSLHARLSTSSYSLSQLLPVSKFAEWNQVPSGALSSRGWKLSEPFRFSCVKVSSNRNGIGMSDQHSVSTIGSPSAALILKMRNLSLR